MLCFWVNAHHHLNPCIVVSWNSLSPSSTLMSVMYFLQIVTLAYILQLKNNIVTLHSLPRLADQNHVHQAGGGLEGGQHGVQV